MQPTHPQFITSVRSSGTAANSCWLLSRGLTTASQLCRPLISAKIRQCLFLIVAERAGCRLQSPLYRMYGLSTNVAAPGCTLRDLRTARMSPTGRFCCKSRICGWVDCLGGTFEAEAFLSFPLARGGASALTRWNGRLLHNIDSTCRMQRSRNARDRRDRRGARHKLGEPPQVLCDRRESELERCAARAP